MDTDWLTVQQNLAGVGLIQPVQNLHQRALARAVFAQQRVDFARAHVEINPVASQHTGKRLVMPRISI
jgi:hypothetical protein